MAAKTVAVVQSCYIPWKGYFDLINLVDEFILFDDRQYTRRDWRNRNRIKTPQGTAWLTIPVEVKGRYHQRIDETRTQGLEWRERHWKGLAHNYRAAPWFEAYAGRFAPLYLDETETQLSRINRAFIAAACDVLGIETTISWSTDYPATGTRSDRLVSLCSAAGATDYLSGPAARAYLDEGLFAERDITISYMDYSGYPAYEQLFPPFEHTVTVLDLIFNAGEQARKYMKSFPESLCP